MQYFQMKCMFKLGAYSGQNNLYQQRILLCELFEYFRLLFVFIDLYNRVPCFYYEDRETTKTNKKVAKL